MNNTDTPIRASLWLERALLFSFIVHGLAMLSMALLLLPGMSGGTSPNDTVRIGYIAENPWLWRLGWLPWQLTAFSDVVLAYCVPQDRAMSSQPWLGRICRHEIDLGIPLESCEPLAGTVQSTTAEEIVGNASPVCFRVARVNFLFARTEYDQV